MPYCWILVRHSTKCPTNDYSSNSGKVLLVTINSTLSWNHHIDTITKKANNTTDSLDGISHFAHLMLKLPISRPFCAPRSPPLHKPDYASGIWDLHTQSNYTNKIEAVQRRAARFVTGDYRRTSSVSSMLGHLGWEEFHTRRQYGKMALMYRIVNHLVELPASPFFSLSAHLEQEDITTDILCPTAVWMPICLLSSHQE